jgi:tRNA(fMet)-specific endonuclease VapC
MTVTELRFGALNSSDSNRGLAAVAAFLSGPIEIVAFDADQAREHADVRFGLKARPIGDRDLVIAATAKSGGFTVVTRSRKHFMRAPGLTVEDWSDGWLKK